MGVDISLFEKKSKVRLMADRAWVCSEWDSEDPAMYDLGGDFRDPNVGLNNEWALYFLNECLVRNTTNSDREEDRKDYAKYWLTKMIDFVQNNPNGTFFIVTDHEDYYFDLCEDYSTIDPFKGAL